MVDECYCLTLFILSVFDYIFVFSSYVCFPSCVNVYIYNMYIIASMAFLIQSMLVGTGAGSLIRLPRQTVCLR